ncbi:MAG: aldo/keto reductase [Saprospiraceae bacterium]|nr:aldo/keto reductase [Saprospiraceae bacterium]
MISPAKTLMLGTAQWGWTVSRHEAFQLLDTWLGAGFRHIDCATNYPINRNPIDFRAAEKILCEYIHAHGLHDFRITMKIGSLDNMRSPEVNLAPSFVQMMTEEYRRLLGANLACAMFHWDNRSQIEEIRGSLEALDRLQQDYGIRPGLSGIAHPEVYAKANTDLGLSFEIQLKHNVLQSDLERYAPLSATAAGDGGHHSITPSLHHSIFAYGINAGGVKLEAPYPSDSTFLARGGQPEKVAPLLGKINALLPDWNTAFVRPPVKTMNHIGLIFAGLHPDLSGILLGVSSVIQLRETLDFWRNFEVFEYSDVFSSLKKILLPTQAKN